MFYSIRHVTRFRYSAPVRESLMELRMQPRSEGHQTLRSFQIATTPKAQLFAYNDPFGNGVFHFNVLREHSELRIEAQSTIEVQDIPPLPAAADTLEWQRYNSFNLTGEHYDMLEESAFARTSPALLEFIAAHDLEKPKGDPLTALKTLNAALFAAFDYEVGITEVHSPIEKALEEKRGVCQDFAHIMIAIARRWGVPTRYVSGYLQHQPKAKDRSAEDATHAWVEAYMPSFGWVGFDPTNNIVAGERHLRAAVGRDYDDVPPTRGTFKGKAESELAVSVTVTATTTPARQDDYMRVSRAMTPEAGKPTPPERQYYQQQQQQ